MVSVSVFGGEGPSARGTRAEEYMEGRLSLNTWIGEDGA